VGSGDPVQTAASGRPSAARAWRPARSSAHRPRPTPPTGGRKAVRTHAV